ncbi:MAG TPA: response regulator [Chlorobaculum sp.]|jgi:DNA-binding response OmpR family regulator|nr:response regulator [Chlorobaculum sp.]
MREQSNSYDDFKSVSRQPDTAVNRTAPAAAKPDSKTILIVDDEPNVLKICKLILEDKGYRVLAASSPDEAIRIAVEYPGKIELLLTDVIMPEMNGRELSIGISTLHPHIGIMYMSGYAANMFEDRGVFEGVNFIHKPFSIRELTAKIQNLLDRR